MKVTEVKESIDIEKQHLPLHYMKLEIIENQSLGNNTQYYQTDFHNMSVKPFSKYYKQISRVLDFPV